MSVVSVYIATYKRSFIQPGGLFSERREALSHPLCPFHIRLNTMTLLASRLPRESEGLRFLLLIRRYYFPGQYPLDAALLFETQTCTSRRRSIKRRATSRGNRRMCLVCVGKIIPRRNLITSKVFLRLNRDRTNRVFMDSGSSYSWYNIFLLITNCLSFFCTCSS